MGSGLWEIRTDLPTNRTARVLVCLYRERLVALHAFIKKMRATPDEDLALAAQAVKEVVAWQLAEAMKKKKISKNRMATMLKTSRTQVDRLLSAKDDITLSSLQRAAAVVGRRVTIELV
jgi:antitoxin HicB